MNPSDRLGDRHPARLSDDLDRARRSGPLQSLVVPACPAMLIQLRRAMSAPEPDLNEVARIASSDVAMSAMLIRRAHAAEFAAMQPARTVGQALTRLGTDLAATVMTEFLVTRGIRADFRQLGRFWEHSRHRALAMASLARTLPGVSPDLAHTTGLFLHVGLPVMLQGLKGFGSTMVEAQARRDRSVVQTENANHRTDHTVVGALVARVWDLAPEVMAVVRLHHDDGALADERVAAEVRTLLALSHVADHLLRRRDGLPADLDWERHGAAALAWLQTGPEELEIWLDHVNSALDEG